VNKVGLGSRRQSLDLQMRKTGHKGGMDTALEAQLRAIIAEQAELIKPLH
jgi:hypothetical protein